PSRRVRRGMFARVHPTQRPWPGSAPGAGRRGLQAPTDEPPGTRPAASCLSGITPREAECHGTPREPGGAAAGPPEHPPEPRGQAESEYPTHGGRPAGSGTGYGRHATTEQTDEVLCVTSQERTLGGDVTTVRTREARELPRDPPGGPPGAAHPNLIFACARSRHLTAGSPAHPLVPEAFGTTRTEAEMPSTAAEVRNVVLVGHTGAGKTALAEDLLTATGAGAGAGQQGRHQEGDHHSTRGNGSTRGISLTLSALHHRGMTINLLDTPGYPDFVGELRAGLRAADAALFVVSAVDGIDGATKALWSECASVDMPRAVVVTRLDHPRADFAAAVAACQDAFGGGVLPAYLPDGAAGSDHGARLVGLLTGRVVEYAGRDRQEVAGPAALDGAAEEARGALIEGIIAESEDETLLDRYLGGEELDPK